MIIFQKLYRFSLIVLLIGTFISVSILLRLFILEKWKLAKARARLLSFACRRALNILSFKVKWQGELDNLNKPGLFVSNHMSYLDVIVLASKKSSSFVTSMEIKNDLFLGTLCRLASCFFVERRSKMNLKYEMAELGEALENGLSITIFPEATSTNGEKIKPFKRSLYTPAFVAQKEITPLCLNYVSIDGQSMTTENRDGICWYGSMAFFPHLWNLLGLKSVEARVTVGESIFPECDMDSKKVAHQTYEIISRNFISCLA